MGSGVVAMDWARHQWGVASLGDKRRTERVVRLGASLMECSSGSLPEQTGNWNDLRAAYRVLAEPDVTHEALNLPHWGSTRDLAGKAGSGPVLFIQDGTELDFTSHPHTTGLGFIGNGSTRGLELHTTLCVLPGGEPEVLGMAYSTVWARGDLPIKGTETRAERDRRHKETDVWGDSVEAIGPAPERDTGTRWVSVSDRGSDIFSFLCRAGALGWSCLVRSKHDRQMVDSDGRPGRLQTFARSLAPSGRTGVHLRSRPGRAACDVSLGLAWAPVVLLPPAHTKGEPIPAWCLRVWEDAQDGLEWILVSTDAIRSLDDALEKVGWYKTRWLVEEYHKCLKTGCGIERRQVSTGQSLKALLGLLGVVAVLLLQHKTAHRAVPVPPPIRDALEALSKRRLEEGDAREFLRRVAMLGGFLGRKRDGEPGWQTIWKGWNRLQDIALGMELAQQCARA